jgi:hypothetical protein
VRQQGTPAAARTQSAELRVNRQLPRSAMRRPRMLAPRDPYD